MFQNMNPLSKSTAILEIFIMLFVAFILGYILHWLICKQSKCCQCKHSTDDQSLADDLKVIEGIGPKIEELLHNNNIRTFEEVVKAGSEKLSIILNKAGNRYSMHDTTTWPRQAELANKGEWAELKKLQDKLTAGRA